MEILKFQSLNESLGISDEAQELCEFILSLNPGILILKGQSSFEINNKKYPSLSKFKIKKIKITKLTREDTSGSFLQTDSSIDKNGMADIHFELDHNSTKSTILHECLHAIQYIKRKGSLSSRFIPLIGITRKWSNNPNKSREETRALLRLSRILYYCSESEVSAHLHSMYQEMKEKPASFIRSASLLKYNLATISDDYCVYLDLKKYDIKKLFEDIPKDIIINIIYSVGLSDFISDSRGKPIKAIFKILWNIKKLGKMKKDISDKDIQNLIKEVTKLRDKYCDKFLRSAAKVGSKLKDENDLENIPGFGPAKNLKKFGEPTTLPPSKFDPNGELLKKFLDINKK